DDHRLGVNPAGADIVEDPAVLRFVVLLGVGIVAPDGAVVRNVDSSGGIAGEGSVGVLAGDVVGRRRQILLGGPGGRVGPAHHDVVRCVARGVGAGGDAAGTAGGGVHHVRVFPHQTEDLVASAGDV